MLKLKNLCLIGIVAAACAFVSCEKMIIEETEGEIPENTNTNPDESKANLIIRVSGAGLKPLAPTRGDTAITALCSTLNVVLYRDGVKKEAVTQTKGSEGFGQVAMTLEEGTYQLLVLAHSSDGNPTLSNPQKIDFSNKVGFSDTFYYYGDVEVTSEKKQVDVKLERISSMLRFTTKDTIPSTVKQIWIQYTGGSGAFDATTGLGNEASQQKKEVNVTADMVGQTFAINLFTILKAQADDVKVTITVYGAAPKGSTIPEQLFQKEYTNIHMERNKITEFSGYLFSEAPDDPDNPDPGPGPTPGEEGDFSFNITANPDWDGIISYSY